MKQCSENYADMLRLHRPVSGRHARMDKVARGAQFAPFAALTGYDAVIRETGRLTEGEPWLEAAEAIGEIGALNEANTFHGVLELSWFVIVLRALAEDPDREAVFVCFLPDREKTGGSFVSYRGRVARVDPIQKTVLLDTAQTFPISAIYDIEQGD